MTPTTDNIEAAEELLLKASDAYHNGAPIMLDAEFDLLWREHQAAREAAPDNPVWKDTILDRVGAPATAQSGFKKVSHTYPMLSLDNVFTGEDEDISELIAWLVKVETTLRSPTRILLEPKVDGLSVRLTYKEGKLVQAVTRGDGAVGDDVTENVVGGNIAPAALDGEYPDVLEVNVEVYMPGSTFAALNADLIAKEEEPLANPRNAAAGALRLKDPIKVAARGLTCIVHGVPAEDRCEGGEVVSWSESMQRLREMGFRCSDSGGFMAASDLADCRESTLRVLALSGYEDVPIDGLVAKVDSYHQRKILGFGTRAPKWAVALKFQQQKAITVVEEIIVQVGRSGTLTPVAVLTPVEVDGSTITRATLHNEAQIQRLGLLPGDEVEIHKAGAIIPEIIRSISASKRTPAPPFSLMTHVGYKCPSCGASDLSGSISPKGGGRASAKGGKPLTGSDMPSIDYAKMEAHFAEMSSPEVTDALRDGRDLYREAASEMYGTPLDKVSDTQRKNAKTCYAMLAFVAGPDFKQRVDYCAARGCFSGEPQLITYTCGNKEACPAQMAARIEHMAGRSALNIEMLGGEASEAIADMGIDHPFDLLSWSQEDFAEISWVTPAGGRMTLGSSRAAKIVASIERADQLPLRQWLVSLGISTVGVNTSKEVARLHKDIEMLISSAEDDGGLLTLLDEGAKHTRAILKEEYGVSHHLGPVSVGKLRRFLRQHAETLRLIPSSVVSDNYAPKPEPAPEGSFTGKKFVVTGKLSVSRGDIQVLIEAAGGVCSGSVSGKTDYLVAGEKAGSKLEKAKKLGVAVLTEEELRGML